MSTISIIATVLNESSAIDRLVRSLLSQSLQPLEIVIVDGGSTDGTWEKLQEHAKSSALLRAISDESCNLKNSRGPIARGRNRAISASRGEVIACCDAGCSYGPNWLERLVQPLRSSNAEYVLGGSCIDSHSATVWDLAAAPLMGIAISPVGMRRSCTARSMAFTRKLWERVGGFPEDTLLGEDTVFDERVQKGMKAAYADGAMALYAPHFSYASAVGTLARYSAADGALGVRKSRFARMIARCLAVIVAVSLVGYTWWPLLLVGVLELYFAVERDQTVLTPSGIRALIPRLLFSASVPWVTVFHYSRGALTKSNLANPQNTR